MWASVSTVRPQLRGPGALVMRDDQRDAAAPGGRESLVERIQDLVHLLADVRRVDTARGAGDAGQQRQLVDVGGGAGGVEHAGAQPGRTAASPSRSSSHIRACSAGVAGR